jgi:hypothetical protein
LAEFKREASAVFCGWSRRLQGERQMNGSVGFRSRPF